MQPGLSVRTNLLESQAMPKQLMIQQWEVVVAELSSQVQQVLQQPANTAFQHAEVVLAQQHWLLVLETVAGQSQAVYQSLATKTTIKR